MCNRFFDYDDGDFAMSISDNMAMDSDGDLMMRMGDHMAMDMDTGDTVACSARKGVMRRGCLTGQDNQKSDRFAADEREAGESPDAYSCRGTPTNARSAGIFKGL